MNRQEPVIDANATTSVLLTHRVPLSWEELVRIAPAEAPREPTLTLPPAAESAPVASTAAAKAPEPAPAAPVAPAPAPAEPQPLLLTDAEKKAIIARLAPGIEATVRQGLRDALDLAVSNAVTRLKADLERTLSAQVVQAVDKEIRRADLSDIVKR